MVNFLDSQASHSSDTQSTPNLNMDKLNTEKKLKSPRSHWAILPNKQIIGAVGLTFNFQNTDYSGVLSECRLLQLS